MGNRVKGRTKKKSIKTPISSSMSTHRKLSRMGKNRKKNLAGIDASFIGRAVCLKRLQISLKDFRRLCILKGVYPREPRTRTPRAKKKGQTLYHIKDVQALAHEPLLEKFREFKAFMKKVRRAAGRHEMDEAVRKDDLAPTYTIHHLIKERYPRFNDALGDLDDALSLVYLFASLPSQGRIKTKVTHKARCLASSWGAYCSTTSSITKSFVSVKGVYLEAAIRHSTIRWVVPHSFAQQIPKDVDFRVMLTFFEFYETLLGFVLFKLYNDVGIRYPLVVTYPDVSASSSIFTAHLHVLHRILREANGAASEAVTKVLETESNFKDGGSDKKFEVKYRNVNATKNEFGSALTPIGATLNKINATVSDDDEGEEKGDISASLKIALEQLSEDHNKTIGAPILTTTTSLDDKAMKRKHLFAGLTFFISREVPTGYLDLVSLAYGAKVGWEDEDSTISRKDVTITHIITDRDSIPSSYENDPKSREYVQPQWVLDCANFKFLLPCYRYRVGLTLPPHLSPWADYEEEGYKPAYAEEVERMIHGESFEISETCNTNGLVECMAEMEDSGTIIFNDKQKQMENCKVNELDDEDEKGDEERSQTRVGNDHKAMEKEKRTRTLAKTMMSKKAARLYGRMQHGLAEKKVEVKYLNCKQKEIEVKKGKSATKNKYECIKAQRKAIEYSYNDTGGSIKKIHKK